MARGLATNRGNTGHDIRSGDRYWHVVEWLGSHFQGIGNERLAGMHQKLAEAD